MIPKQWQIAIDVINQIEHAGFEAFIVGGAVRDYYLTKENNDIDIATSALPQEIQAIFPHTIDVGIEHGTVLVLHQNEPIEVTTYRTESTYTDHRRPDAVHFVRNLAEDLKRRDFTMNAMALSQSGDFIDLFDGRKHIDEQLICAVGNAEERFKEDALRMLRAVRFAAQLNFKIDDQTFAAIQKQAASIELIAMERIQVELSKIFTSQFPAQGIHYMQESNLAKHLNGEFDSRAWQYFQSENRQVGWAYFCLVNNELALLTQFRCSNKDKQFAKQVLEAYDCLLKGIEKIELLYFDVEILHTAYQFTQWQQQTINVSWEQLQQQKLTLPIQSAKELAITGQDVMAWSHKKRGPWIKEMLDTSLRAVVNGDVVNDKQKLKEWFHATNVEG
ncbi:CCA tRNA nucleotidyltransferase [Solibacillus sp. MA9]|uniref:CCA tRNA nucleotidyltransferase n=1 Tax=Solibacillus palustris TaxID=2908203 RepID=A0ABS9UAB5_9BACL|nr:CCA tRNA nucleotidyltransferase [Solibacillus sp. MA9]MCH7321267.1 CCA tRNA nucleotidyltransferase [Solibacillus sp. MA9]